MLKELYYNCCTILKNTFEQIANYCLNLKHLDVVANRFADGTSNTLFQQYFGNLEVLTCDFNDEISGPKVFKEGERERNGEMSSNILNTNINFTQNWCILCVETRRHQQLKRYHNTRTHT